MTAVMAGKHGDYIPTGMDEQILAHTSLVAGGDSDTVTFTEWLLLSLCETSTRPTVSPRLPIHPPVAHGPRRPCQQPKRSSNNQPDILRWRHARQFRQ